MAMEVVIYLVLNAPALPLLYGLYLHWRGRDRPHWVAALGWLALWTVPAVFFQAGWQLAPGGYSTTWALLVEWSPASLWVLLGGRTVVELFEATAYDLTGHRHATMFDNIHVYLAYTAIQCAILVAVLVRRSRQRHKDPVAVAIGAAVLVNGLLAADWPWWGT